MMDRDLPRSHPGAADYDGTPSKRMLSATARDLPPTHPYAVDNPSRNDAFEKCDQWRLHCQPASLLPKGFTPPPHPGTGAPRQAAAQPAEKAEE